MDGMGSDLRYAVRTLRKSPGFALVAILSLALGIGANAAMFGVVRTLLLTPIPAEAPDELALVTWRRDGDFSISQNGSTDYDDPAGGARLRSNLSYPLYQALRDATPPRVDLFAFAFLRGVSVAIGDQPAFLAGGAMADGAYFSSLRVGMAMGRPLTPADDLPDAPLVVVLSHDFWMRAFGGDPQIVGRTVRINGVPAEVVGVSTEGFTGLSMGGFFPRTEITVPLSAQPRVVPRMSSDESLFSSQDVFWLRLMARIPDGESWDATEQAFAQTLRTFPSPLVGTDGHAPELRLIPGRQGAQPVRPQMAKLLYLLMGVVGIVLLIACVNLASMMLARGVSRQREMAVRKALGGPRSRLVRQALMESLVLAFTGTAVALAITAASGKVLGDVLSGSLGSGAFGNVDMAVFLDPWVLGAGVALAFAATALFGLLPALRLSGADPISWLKDRTAASSSPKLTGGRVLIALQIGVSVPLVVGAALFLRSVANLGAVELGFEPRGLVSFQVDPGYTQLPEEDYGRLYQELLASIQQVPGVRSVSLMENALLSGIISNSTITVDGERQALYFNAAGPGLVETLGMRLVAGRAPGLQDAGGAPRVGMVNETAVRKLFGGSSPIGRTLQVGSREVQIIGVVEDTPYRNLRDPVPSTLYESALQRNGYGGHHVVMRTDAPLGALERAVREAVYRVNPHIPVPELRSQTAIMAQTSARERVFTQVLTLFGAFALLLASIGLHGVTSYAVTRRTSEIGIRVAVGAQPREILWLILRQVVILAGAGLVLGVPLALAVSPLVGSLLYGIAPTNPFAVAGAAAVMMTIAVVAGMLPALMAARMDALAALRTE